MAGKSSVQDTMLLEITSEWFLDYCIYQLWKEFKEKRSFSDRWRDAIQGKVMGTTSIQLYSIEDDVLLVAVQCLLHFYSKNVSNFVLFIPDFLVNGRFDIGKELSNKLSCIRFIVGLVEHREDVSSSQDSTSDEEESCEQSKRLLNPDCLKFFDKIAGIYPFSDVEKLHMRNTLKLQVTLCLIANEDVMH